ncbi:MAG: hypothetical protein ACREH3_00210 [Geminicoccales bacterium]
MLRSIGQEVLGVIELLEKFQAGIVGVLGFAGVIITLVVNACITRRHARETRSHERETLARALLAELSSQRRSVKDNVEIFEKAGRGKGELLVPAIAKAAVFNANVSHLGRLSAVQVGPVLEAYIVLEEFDRVAVYGCETPRCGFMPQPRLVLHPR